MAANKFVLKGSRLEVDYTIGGNPSFPALTCKAGAFVKTFKPAEIKTEDTGLGKMVSVALILSIDTGGERFGFFLPFIDVAHGNMANFQSAGVHETFTGPKSGRGAARGPHRDDSGQCFPGCSRQAHRGTVQVQPIPLKAPSWTLP